MKVCVQSCFSLCTAFTFHWGANKYWMWNKEKEPHPFSVEQNVWFKETCGNIKKSSLLHFFFTWFPCSGWYLPRFPGPESPSGRKPPATSPAEHWIPQEQPALLQQPRGVPGGIPWGPGPHERLQGPRKWIQRWAAARTLPDLCLHRGNTRSGEQVLHWPGIPVRHWDG